MLPCSPPQITCQACDRVSEREEEFLDIPLALCGHSGLEDTLREAYIKQESLETPNQYFCERCQKLVDAKRVWTLMTGSFSIEVYNYQLNIIPPSSHKGVGLTLGTDIGLIFTGISNWCE